MKKMLSLFLQGLDTVKKPQNVYAHCDIPCGIYTPATAQLAAQTVEKMLMKLQELKMPAFANPPAGDAGASVGKPDDQTMLAYLNSVARMVAVKEKHAELCKKELLILWTDYFKPEHLKMFPNLHETFWKAAKLCSKNKQEVNLEAARELRKTVDEIARIFEKAEEAKKLH